MPNEWCWAGARKSRSECSVIAGLRNMLVQQAASQLKRMIGQRMLTAHMWTPSGGTSLWSVMNIPGRTGCRILLALHAEQGYIFYQSRVNACRRS